MAAAGVAAINRLQTMAAAGVAAINRLQTCGGVILIGLTACVDAYSVGARSLAHAAILRICGQLLGGEHGHIVRRAVYAKLCDHELREGLEGELDAVA